MELKRLPSVEISDNSGYGIVTNSPSTVIMGNMFSDNALGDVNG